MQPKQNGRTHIVIVGGGIAGLALATRLGHRLGLRGEAQISLVDRNLSHVWKPMLHTFAAGTANAYQEKISYLAHAATHGFGFIPGTMTDVDVRQRRIVLAPILSEEGAEVLAERSVPYDFLVLAGGSRANDFGTPGVAEWCQFIDDLHEAQNFNRLFYDDLLRAAEMGTPLNIAIVGGGATGVELAAEVHQLVAIAKGYGSGLDPKLGITLIESGPRILAAFPESVATGAHKQLSELGVRVLTSTRVVAADENGFVLADGSRIDSRLRVWAAGIRAPGPFAGIGEFEHARSGQIVVGPDLRVKGTDNVFAIGDCASLTVAPSDRPLPPTAQVARQQALHLARHLPASLQGRPIPPFKFRDLGSLVSLGKYNAFGTLGRQGFYKGGFIQGQFARLSHAALYRLHQVELHGAWRAALLWISAMVAASVRPNIRVD